MKQLLLIIIACVITSCSKTETPDCQSCHTVEYVYIGWNQWGIVQNIGFTDCTMMVRDEDRTYEVEGDVYRRVTKCVKN